MLRVALLLAAASSAALVTHRATVHLARRAALQRCNYRGVPVATAGGIAPLAGVTVAAGTLALISWGGRVGTAAAPAALAPWLLAAALGFGLLGLWDDVAAGSERGWRGHVGALRRARLTSGAIKMVAGGALAIALVAPLGRGPWWTLADAALLALTANVFNLLDVRPGRSAKVALVALAVLLATASIALAPMTAAALAAVAVFLPADLRERTMLGDVGANGIGALVGAAVVLDGSGTLRLVLLGVIALLHAIADGPSLSRVIERIPPLRAADRLGRIPE